MDMRKQMGWLQKAYVLSFYFLLRFDEYVKSGLVERFYLDSIRAIITEGGDTDTNAAIAGGMIGALVGFNNIPDYMIDKIIKFDCTKVTKSQQNGIRRPYFLSTKIYLLQNIQKLIELIPSKDLNIVKE